MRYTFDSTFPELGAIKELLKEFNLPKYPVATDDTKLYDGKMYIDGLELCRYNATTGRLHKMGDYYFNRPMLNLTTDITITTSYYSTDLHEYLGNYLRFIRDYCKLNLMSLYNCFSNRVIFPENYDENYNYYAIPVKFNQVYTIGFDSPVPVEIYCTIWDSVEIESLSALNVLKSNTKQIVQGCTIDNPFVYTKLKDFDATDFLSQFDNLKLIIKLPVNNRTSITVLEGDYSYDTIHDGTVTTTMTHGQKYDKEYLKSYPTDLSLFKVNDLKKHPFADRLVEYLLDTAITQVDILDDNIKRVQEYLLYLRRVAPKILYGVWDERMNDTIYDIANDSFLDYERTKRFVKNKTNIWHRFDSADDYSNNSKTEESPKAKNLIDVRPDLLMYVDKDVEELFLATDREEKYTR